MRSKRRGRGIFGGFQATGLSLKNFCLQLYQNWKVQTDRMRQGRPNPSYRPLIQSARLRIQEKAVLNTEVSPYTLLNNAYSEGVELGAWNQTPMSSKNWPLSFQKAIRYGIDFAGQLFSAPPEPGLH